MPWQPITEKALLALVKEELAQMPEDLYARYVAAHQGLSLVPCDRGMGTEFVFLVFRCNDRFVIYDDVEEEFAVAMESNMSHGVMRTWVPAGSLEWAMKAVIFEG